MAVFRKPLDKKDDELILLLYEKPTITNTDLAKKAKLSLNTIKKRLQNQNLQEKIKEHNQSDFEKLKSYRSQAIDTIVQLMATSENDNVKLNAAKEIVKGINPDNIDLNNKKSLDDEAKELLRLLSERKA